MKYINKKLTFFVIATLTLLQSLTLYAEAKSASNNHNLLSIQASLQSQFDEIVMSANYPGAKVTIMLENNIEIHLASGFADKEKKELMSVSHLMPAGSVGKTFVAPVILMIADEYRVDLDIPVTQFVGDQNWFKGMPNENDITLRMLLNHTSGIVTSHLDHPSIEPIFHKTFGSKGKDLVELGIDYRAAIEALKDSKPQFAAGKGWMYSDANYILAGLIAEQICSCKIFDEIEKRLISVANLDETFPTPRRHINYAAGYETTKNVLPGSDYKLTMNKRLYYDPSLEWAGGGLASSTSDLARWAKALFFGKIVSGTIVDEMITSTSDLIPTQLGWKYGLGVQVAEDQFGLRLMHGGYIPGYSTYLEYQRDHGRAIAMQINTRSGFGANRKIVDQLLTTLDNLSKLRR